MSRKRSSKEDPNSDTSQLLNSQEFRNDYFSDHKTFSSYDISGASWWHKVTPDEHKQLHGAMLHFFMEQCFMVLHPKSACQKPRERREHNQDDLLPLPSINHRTLAETGCRVQWPLVWPSWQDLQASTLLEETLPHQYTDLLIPCDGGSRGQRHIC